MLLATFATTAAASGKLDRSDDRATFTLVAIPETVNVPIERGITFTDRLETTGGAPIEGWDGGRCVNLNPDPEVLSQWMCELVFHLPEGDIVSAGPFDLTGTDIVFAVTGGTGAFRNARGEVEVVSVPGAEDEKAFAHFRLLGATANY